MRRVVRQFAVVAFVVTIGAASRAPGASAQAPSPAANAPRANGAGGVGRAPADDRGSTAVRVASRGTVPPSTSAVDGLRLVRERTFANGALRFAPATANVKFVRSKAAAVRLARKELLPGPSAPTPEVFFAGYTLETTERISSGPTRSTRDQRNVWVVRFPRIDGERRSGVILRANLPTVVPVTTTPRRVLTDVLVVVDDQTGEVLLRSEFAPEPSDLDAP